MGTDPYRIEGTGRVFLCPVVGESHYQDALEAAAGGRSIFGAQARVTALLVLESTNPYDNQAVRVDVDGRTVGYLARTMARAFRAFLPPGVVVAEAQGIIRGGRVGDGAVNFGMWLDVPVDEMA